MSILDFFPCFSGGPVLQSIRRRKILFRLAASIAGLCLAFVGLELFCRTYEPLRLRVRGGRIILPASVRWKFHNSLIEKIDEEIVHSRNRLGFRGDEPPSDFSRHLTIVAVGGSTTECYYLSDGQTWPEQLGQRLEPRFDHAWVNNAGLDGQSTYGHAKLLDQYLVDLHPDVILFLIGANDVGLQQPASSDTAMQPGAGQQSGWMFSAWRALVEHSAVLSVIDNIRRTRAAHNAGVVHGNVSHAQLLLDAENAVAIQQSTIQNLLDGHRSQYLVDYRARVEQLVGQCRKHEMHAVLMTQPALFGDAVDPTTGIDLGTMRMGNINGGARWAVLELYNDVVRSVASEQSVDLIDLAQLMPKDSRYYYDYYHFTNEGAERISTLVAEQLIPILGKLVPDGRTGLRQTQSGPR